MPRSLPHLWRACRTCVPCAFTATCLLGAPLTARAQASADAGEERTATTVARPQDAVEDPRFASGTVTRVPLEGEGPSGDRLPSALERVSGVYVRRQSSFGQPAYVQIRGGNPRQSVVLLNGVRVSLPTGLGFDVGSLGVRGFDEVRVYRGASSIMHGAGALTGAVELRAEPPRNQPTSASARVGAGSFGTRTIGTQAAASGRLGAGRLAASFRHSDGDFPFVDAQGVPDRRINNDYAQLHTLGTAGWGETQRRVDATLLYNQGARGVAGLSEFQRTFDGARLQERRLVLATRGRQRAIARGDGWVLDLEERAGLQWRELDYTNDTSVIGQSTFASDASAVTVDAAAEAALYTDAGNFSRASIELRHQDYSSRSDVGGDARRLRAGRDAYALALGSEQLVWGDALSLTAAGRVEAIEGERRDWTPLIGGIGAIWRVHPAVRIFANAARTYRVPDFDELYLDTEFVRGTPDLRAERAWVADAAVRLGAPEGRASLEVVGYGRRTEDQIAFLPVTAYLYQAQNLREVLARGVEATGSIDPINRVRVSAGYTFTDAFRVDLPELPLPNQPRHRLDARMEISLARLAWLGRLPGLAVTGRAAWRSEIALDTFASTINPGWWRLDIGARVAPTRWITLRADVTNLLDVRRALDTLQRPLPGRAFFISMDIHRAQGASP